MKGKNQASIILRKPKRSDVPILFDQQNDAGAHRMVGVTSHAPDDRKAYFSKWEKIFADDGIIARTILFQNEIAGVINSFHAPWSNRLEVGYWLGREFWGKGIATKALGEFLLIDNRRPLGATAVVTNKGSIKVLQTCGFEIVDTVDVELEGGEVLSEHRFELL
ncbi:MAG: GNAT family N-acetyltransferase [Pyrinomonadaceae bacterium]|nr:GNAT family N-acetyltransferase [Pyrinomonadaceae bacterium]